MLTRFALLPPCCSPPAVHPPARAPHGFVVEILVDGRSLPEYAAARYIEAVKGRDYEIQLHTPARVRVAVACRWMASTRSTRGARVLRTLASGCRTLYETTTVRGWQIGMEKARECRTRRLGPSRDVAW